jgi:hypothetical protein
LALSARFYSVAADLSRLTPAAEGRGDAGKFGLLVRFEPLALA